MCGESSGTSVADGDTAVLLAGLGVGRAVVPALPRWLGPGRVRETGGMCRSIKTLRPPAIPNEATEDEIRAAALQYVRKVSGFRVPAAHNRAVFDRAVDAVAAATGELLAGLEVRGRSAAASR